jgi:hypothetical protein
MNTIRNEDLIVPFEGFEDGLTGRQRGRALAGCTPGAASFFAEFWKRNFYRLGCQFVLMNSEEAVGLLVGLLLFGTLISLVGAVVF